LPTLYRSTVRIAVELPASSTLASDPYFFQTETEKITSRVVLNQVIRELGLTSRRAQENEMMTALTNEESYQRLKRALYVRQSRNTSLLEVGVLDENRATAAQIANAVADVYRRYAKSTKSLVVEVVDRAEPGIRPVRPNVPMSLTMGWLGSVIVAALVARVTRRWLPTNRGAES
jgi:capsular polysaccharide biosynthesis protein